MLVTGAPTVERVHLLGVSGLSLDEVAVARRDFWKWRLALMWIARNRAARKRYIRILSRDCDPQKPPKNDILLFMPQTSNSKSETLNPSP